MSSILKATMLRFNAKHSSRTKVSSLLKACQSLQKCIHLNDYKNAAHIVVELAPTLKLYVQKALLEERIQKINNEAETIARPLNAYLARPYNQRHYRGGKSVKTVMLEILRKYPNGFSRLELLRVIISKFPERDRSKLSNSINSNLYTNPHLFKRVRKGVYRIAKGA